MEEARDGESSGEPRLSDLVEERALAEELGLKSVDPIRALRYGGKLQYVKIGGAIFYHEPTLMRYLLDNAEGHVRRPRPQAIRANEGSE